MSEDQKTEMSLALSSMWDYLCALNEEGKLDDEALAHIYKRYADVISQAYDLACKSFLEGGD